VGRVGRRRGQQVLCVCSRARPCSAATSLGARPLRAHALRHSRHSRSHSLSRTGYHENGTTSWEFPVAEAAASSGGLPAGWGETQDGDGNTYCACRRAAFASLLHSSLSVPASPPPPSLSLSLHPTLLATHRVPR
jgi:hypothetical protein